MTSPYIHPYPDYVIESIEDQMHETYSARGIPVTVEEVLEWLWQAQRIDTPEQLKEQVPDFATIIDKDGDAYKAFEAQNPDMFPVRVVYWKDN